MAKSITGTVTAVDIEQKVSKKTGNTFNIVFVTVGNIKADTFLSSIVKPSIGDTVVMSYEPVEQYRKNTLLSLKNLTLEASMENSDVSNQDN